MTATDNGGQQLLQASSEAREATVTASFQTAARAHRGFITGYL